MVLSHMLIPKVDGESSLSAYLNAIKKFPMLTQEQEIDLIKKYKDGDDASKDIIVTSHLRLAAKIAMKYRGYKLPLADIISESNLGILHALKRFDPDKGFRFSTYAIWWIRANVQEYVLHNWSLVKIGTTSAQKKLFFSLRRVKNKLQAMEDDDKMNSEMVSMISETLNVSEKDVVDMNQRMSHPDHSLNTPKFMDSNDEWQDWIVDNAEDPETSTSNTEEKDILLKLLEEKMPLLNERERGILSQRRLVETPVTLNELSKTYGISRERIRQIETRAFEKLKKSIIDTAFNKKILSLQN